MRIRAFAADPPGRRAIKKHILSANFFHRFITGERRNYVLFVPSKMGRPVQGTRPYSKP